MYVCMYVCMYIYMYVCSYYVCTTRCSMYVYYNEWRYVCMCIYVNVCYVCNYYMM